MSFYGGSRLPFARLQNSPKLSKRFPAAPRRHSGRVILSCSSNKSLKPWQCPFMEVQGCRLPAFTTRQNSPNAYSTLCSPPRSHSGHSNFCPLPTGHSCSNLGFYGVPRRNRPRQTLCSSNKSLRPWHCPFKEVQGCRLPAFTTRQNFPNASLQLPGATQAAVNLSCSSNKSLRPWQSPFKEVQGCRLPGFKTCQNSPNASLQLPGATQAAVNLSCSSNKSLKPWQCPFMEVQGCRLPGFTTRQNSPNASLQLPGATQAALILSCSSNKSLKPWQCPFMEVQGCRLPAFTTRQNSPNAYSTLCSPPRSHSGHSNFCPLPTGHSCSNLGFYGVPRRNRPRQTLCSSNKSLRPWQCPF